MTSMADTNKTDSCEARIAGQLAGRIEQLADIFNRSDAYDSDDPSGHEEALEELDTLPLSIDTRRVVKILLSTGGPADWFDVTLDESGEIDRIEYVFQDWFDVARRDVSPGTEEYDAAMRFCSYFIEVMEQ